MTTRQEILLRLACAALQGGMSIDEVCDSIQDIKEDNDSSLWDIADILPCVEFDADIPSEKDIELVTGKKDFY